MKHVRRIVCVAIIAIMMAGLMACSAPVQESQAPAAGASETVSQEPSASATGSDAASAKSSGAGFPFELTTFDGAVVTFDHVPERVLAANPDAGEELMALGLGDKIIATSYNYAQVAEEYRAESVSYTHLLAANALVKEGIKEKAKVKEPSKARTVYDRLVAAGRRLIQVIERNRGGANKSLAKFADQINSLADKWDR